MEFGVASEASIISSLAVTPDKSIEIVPTFVEEL
jgi:hypothetical protein